ncbi:MAG: hypothetical protein WD066_04990 [Planctomycetaceae bacterium]
MRDTFQRDSAGRIASGRALFAVLMAVAAMSCGASAGRGDDGTAAYFDGLRRLGLFGLAEGHCFEQLGRRDLSAERRVEFTIELSRTFAEHAKYSSGDEQDELWRRSLDVLDEFVKEHGDSPRAIEVRTQGAFARATQGEYLRWQAELFAHDDALLRRADAALAQAGARLAEAEQALETRFTAARAARGTPDGGPSALRLRTLLENVRHRQALALLDRAKLAPRRDPNRAAWLIDAEGRLRRLAGAPEDAELTWSSRVLLAECLRLGSEPERAESVLANMLTQNPPPQVREAIAAQRAWVALDLGRPDEAERVLAEHRAAVGTLSGELRWLRVRGLIASWEIAHSRGESQLAADLQTAVAEQADRAEREVGGYWAYRCRMLLEQARQSARYGPELAETIRRAEALYAANRIDAAITEYQRGYDAARASNQADAAMELGYVRASIEAQSQRYADAADHFRELAEAFPTHERAAAAHLLAAWSAGRIFELSPSEPHRAAYERALEAHAERFASHATNHDARWMLAGLREREGKFDQAWEIYRTIPADHPREPAAQGAVARCFERIIERLRSEGRDPARWEQAAEETLGSYVERFPDPDRPLSPPQAEVALRFARILLDRDRPDYDGAEMLLRRIVSSWTTIAATPGGVPVEASAVWKPMARAAVQWRIVALAGRGMMPEAERLVGELSHSGTDDVLSVLDGLTQLTSRATPQARRGLGEVQLQAALQLGRRREELSEDERLRLDRCLAEAYLATNQPRRACEVYETLVARLPKDKDLLRTAAIIELETGTRETLQHAKRNWAKLESFEQPGSDAWIEARYHHALATHRLGDDDEARKLAGVAKLLYPDRGDPETRRNLAELLSELGSD